MRTSHLILFLGVFLPAALGALSGTARVTHYTSYAPCCPEPEENYDPSADTTECTDYNACAYTGQFAAIGYQTLDYVKTHNLVAFYDDSDYDGSEFYSRYGGKTIRLTFAGVTFDAIVADTCGNGDCGGCCSTNSQPRGYLVDIEYWTAINNFGSVSGVYGDIQFEIFDDPPTSGGGSGTTGGGGGGEVGTSNRRCGNDWYDANDSCQRDCPNNSDLDCPSGLKCWSDLSMAPCAATASCSDGIQNQGETGVDCGGPCAACPTCSDGIRNQGETGVDCGGPCSACASCADGIVNQGETGTDCGGPCPACPTCSDGIRNQGELGVDCGGPCEACVEPCVPDTCSDFGLVCGPLNDGCGVTISCGACPAGQTCGGGGLSGQCGAEEERCQTDDADLSVVFTVELAVPPQDFQSSTFIVELATVLDIPQESLSSVELLLDESTDSTTTIRFKIQNVLLEDGCRRVDVVGVAFRLRLLASGGGEPAEAAAFRASGVGSMVVRSAASEQTQASTTGEEVGAASTVGMSALLAVAISASLLL